jgi:hypothetical protein
MGSRAWRLATLLVALSGLLAAAMLDRLSPVPSADVARGSEDAFASGLEPREFSGPLRAPARWTRASTLLRFRNLPPGPRSLEVAVDAVQGPILAAVDGVILGPLSPGTVRFPLPPSKLSSVVVELRATTFAAGGGRTLGVRFKRVALHHERGGLPPVVLILGGLGVGLGVLAAAAAAGAAPAAAALFALLALATQAALLFPMGLLRSDYSIVAPLSILAGAALACAFARWRGTPWAFAALFVSWLVQAVVLTSPMVVTSDALMHANKLVQVARGDFFPRSRTQHAPPFEIPYGVSFYAVVAPFVRLGVEPVTLVRYAAGVSGALAAVPLFLICAQAPARGALAVALLLAMPQSADLLSYGNLSNVFGQTLTLAFLAWWHAPRGGPALGALLLLAAALSHLGSLIVLAVLVPLLCVCAGRGTGRLLAVSIGAVLAALYYGQFLPLITAQLPRLGEGAAAGGQSLGLPGAASRQLVEAVGRWGIPATLLAAIGLVRTVEPRPLLRATWFAGGVLALVAIGSPVEVRYLYAIAFAVALAASDGARRLAAGATGARAGAAFLLAWQALLALSGLREILLERYRP